MLLEAAAVHIGRKDASSVDSKSCKASVGKPRSCGATWTLNILLQAVAVRISRKDAFASHQPPLQLSLP